jgi:hypothetical protein
VRLKGFFIHGTQANRKEHALGTKKICKTTALWSRWFFYAPKALPSGGAFDLLPELAKERTKR